LKLLLSDGEDGLQRRYAEYSKAATAVRRGLEAVGFPMLVEDAFACPLTTAFCPRPGIDLADLQKALLKDAGVMISGGIGDLKGKILRVGQLAGA
jgi:aspartate aminotransferase-like enzyme